MGCRRRHLHQHRHPFLKVTEAETSADLGAFTARLKRAIHEAEVLGLPDVRGHLDAALGLAAGHAAATGGTAERAPGAKSLGQHEAEEVA